MWQQVYDPFGNSVCPPSPRRSGRDVARPDRDGCRQNPSRGADRASGGDRHRHLLFTMPAAGIRATILGAVIGFFPIGWIVLNVIFMYRLTVATGAFGTLQQAIGGVTADRRLQLLLIAFAFGAFFEGASGFGRRSRLPRGADRARFLAAGGSGLSLIANTATCRLWRARHADRRPCQRHRARPLPAGCHGRAPMPFFSLIVPAWLICAFAGWRGMVQIWPAILVCGVSFAVPQFLIPLVNPWIVDIGASLICMACLIGFFRVWQPAELWTSPALRRRDDSAATMPPPPGRRRADDRRGLAGADSWIIVCAVSADLGHRLV